MMKVPIAGLILFAGATEVDIKGWLVGNGFYGPSTREVFQ